MPNGLITADAISANAGAWAAFSEIITEGNQTARSEVVVVTATVNLLQSSTIKGFKFSDQIFLFHDYWFFGEENLIPMAVSILDYNYIR